jgi:hypothetical protein
MRFGNPGTQESQIIPASMTQFSQLLLYSSSQSEGVGDGVGGGVPFINKEKFSSKIKK